MTSIKYTEIYSRFFSKAKTYDLAMLSEEDMGDYLAEQLHSAIAKPYIRQLFKFFTHVDETHDVKYELKRVTKDGNGEEDVESDKLFVVEILAMDMLMEYCQTFIYNPTNLAQVFSDADEKFYSQATHLTSLQNTYDSLHILERRMIGDRGYANNSYLDGDT